MLGLAARKPTPRTLDPSSLTLRSAIGSNTNEKINGMGDMGLDVDVMISQIRAPTSEVRESWSFSCHGDI